MLIFSVSVRWRVPACLRVRACVERVRVTYDLYTVRFSVSFLSQVNIASSTRSDGGAAAARGMLTAASRRAALATAACLCIPAPSPASGVTTLKLPLQMQAGGVLTTGVVIDGEPFRLIVDSGSPYLVVPLDDCDQQPPKLSAYGCADAGRFPPAAFAATEEQYGALPGRMQWLRGDVSFGETEALPRRTGRRVGGDLVFGGADRAVLSQSGGALLGLIRQVNYRMVLSNTCRLRRLYRGRILTGGDDKPAWVN